MRYALIAAAAPLALASAPADAATYIKGSFFGTDPVTGLEIEGQGSFLFRENAPPAPDDQLEDVVVLLQWVNGFVRIGDTVLTPEANNRDGSFQGFTEQFRFSFSNDEGSAFAITSIFPSGNSGRFPVQAAGVSAGGNSIGLGRPNISGFFFLTAVPEPTTWALLIFGFGGIGMAMRYRPRRTAEVRYSFG